MLFAADIDIDWGGLAPTEVYRARIGDLFAGLSVRVQGRFDAPGSYDIVVRGRVNGRNARLPLRLDLSSEDKGDAVRLTWARAAIDDSMQQLIIPVDERWSGLDDDALKTRVTQLGLERSLATRWTAFVAASTRVVNASPQRALDASVAGPMVAGVQTAPYPQSGAQTVYGQPPIISGGGFSGAASPEPATLTGSPVSTGAALAGLCRRRRATVAEGQ